MDPRPMRTSYTSSSLQWYIVCLAPAGERLTTTLIITLFFFARECCTVQQTIIKLYCILLREFLCEKERVQIVLFQLIVTNEIFICCHVLCYSFDCTTLCRFVLTVRKNYRPVAYHNWLHGWNVSHCIYCMLMRLKESTDLFSSLHVRTASGHSAAWCFHFFQFVFQGMHFGLRDTFTRDVC
jgi:hypothetical protein